MGFAQCSGTDIRPQLDSSAQADLARYVAHMPYAQGNHWRAEKDGEVLTVIGTMHFSDPRMDAITSGLTDEITTSGLLLLEATSEDAAAFEQLLSADPALILLADGLLSDHLAAPAWQSVTERLGMMGLSPEVAAQLRPWYAAIMMGLPDCLLTSADAAYGLDKRLEDIARQSGTPVRSLEPADTIVRLFDALSFAEQVEMLEMTTLQRDDIADQTASLIEAYFEESATEGWMLGKVLAARANALPADQVDRMFDQMTDIFLTKRNHNWIPVILEAAANEAAPITVAVGAAHLGGEHGLLKLLADQGFTLTRHPF